MRTVKAGIPAEAQSVRLGDHLGAQIHRIRQARRFTLRAVAERTGVSVPMLSMIERGRSNPSIGTLHAIADAMNISMSDLFHAAERADTASPGIIRAFNQHVIQTAPGVARRVLISDPDHGYEMAENRYDAGTASAPSAIHHSGVEFGFLLEGELEVMIGDRAHLLRAGDSIHFDSSQPHRFRNLGPHPARTIWVNLSRSISRLE